MSTSYSRVSMVHSVPGLAGREATYLEHERHAVEITRQGDTLLLDFGGGRLVEVPWAAVRWAERMRTDRVYPRISEDSEAPAPIAEPVDDDKRRRARKAG